MRRAGCGVPATARRAQELCDTARPHLVLQGIDLDVEEGEFIAIVGYSGSGKTTLISLIAGLITPDDGEICLAGAPITGPGPDRGIVFQNYSLLPWLTVFENIYLAVDAVFPNLPAAAKRQRTEHWARLVNLGDAMTETSPRTVRGHAPARRCGTWSCHRPQGVAAR